MAKTGKYRRRRGLVGNLLIWARNAAILAVIAGIGGKFYADYKLTNYLDQAAGMISPVGTLTVGDSNAGFNGELSASNISFIPDPGVDAPPVVVREAALQTPGLLWLLGIGRSDFPKTMGMTLDGLKVEFGDLLGQGQRSSISGLTTETLGCGDITRFETIDLNNMGFDDMESRVEGRYTLAPPEVIDLRLVVENANASEMLVEMKLASEDLNSTRRGRAPPTAVLNSVSVTLRASEFNRRRNSYCASQAELTVEQFLDQHMDEVHQQAAAAGFELSDELSYQYRRFAEGEGVWTFLSQPYKPIAMADLQGLTPPRALELLNVKSAIASGVPQRVVLHPITVPEQLVDDAASSGDGSAPRPARAMGWKQISLASIGGHTGKNVRIDSKSGKQYTGKLISVSSDSLVIDTLMTGGSAQIPIPLEQVFRARVLTRG